MGFWNEKLGGRFSLGGVTRFYIYFLCGLLRDLQLGVPMIILECDICKSQYKSKGIFSKVINQITVGGQREIKGFEELIPQLKTNDVQDVCQGCMATIKARRTKIAGTKTEGIFIELKEFIREGLNG